MLKGVHKRVIVVQPPRRSSFEKIFFVMKVRGASSSNQDILREANRLVIESYGSRELRGGVIERGSLASFFAGIAVGAVIGMLAVIILI